MGFFTRPPAGGRCWAVEEFLDVVSTVYMVIGDNLRQGVNIMNL